MDNIINQTISFSVSKGEDDVSKLTDSYFLSNGYTRQTSSQFLKYSKGKKGDMFAFDALKWYSTVEAKLIMQQDAATIVECVFNVDTTGQQVFQSELSKWNTFIDNYRAYVEGRPLADIKAQQQSVNKEVRGFFMRVILYLIFVAVLVGLVDGILIFTFKHFGYLVNPQLITMPSMILAIYFVIRKIQKK